MESNVKVKQAHTIRNDGVKTYTKYDGWKNILSGLGGASDKTQQTAFGQATVLVDEELDQLYIGDGWGRKIIDAPADDMTRAWISIEGDAEESLKKEMYRLDVQSIFNKAVKWARLYRGCLVIMYTNDGGSLETPLKNPKRVNNLIIVPPSRVLIAQTDIIIDPTSEYFDDIEIFRVVTRDGTNLNVHASRCLIFKGDPAPPRRENLSGLTFGNDYWGMSALQSIYEKLKNYGATEQHVSNLIMELIISVFKLNNLEEYLDQDNIKAVQNRIDIINASKSMIRSVFIGEGEEFARNTADIGGLGELWDRFMMMLSGVTNIPVTRLFGRSPAGMNSTGEGDLRNYYDMISAKQENWLRRPLMQLVDVISKTLNKTAPMFSFNNPWEPTQAELIDMRKKQSEIDRVYMEQRVLARAEVRDNRFKGGYSFETEVTDDIDPLEEEIIEGQTGSVENEEPDGED